MFDIKKKIIVPDVLKDIQHRNGRINLSSGVLASFVFNRTKDGTILNRSNKKTDGERINDIIFFDDSFSQISYQLKGRGIFNKDLNPDTPYFQVFQPEQFSSSLIKRYKSRSLIFSKNFFATGSFNLSLDSFDSKNNLEITNISGSHVQIESTDGTKIKYRLESFVEQQRKSDINLLLNKDSNGKLTEVNGKNNISAFVSFCDNDFNEANIEIDGSATVISGSSANSVFLDLVNRTFVILNPTGSYDLNRPMTVYLGDDPSNGGIKELSDITSQKRYRIEDDSSSNWGSFSILPRFDSDFNNLLPFENYSKGSIILTTLDHHNPGAAEGTGKVTLQNDIRKRYDKHASLIAHYKMSATPENFGPHNHEVLTGTAQTDASQNLTGVGTEFLNELASGDKIFVGNQTRTVSSITNANELAVTQPFAAFSSPTVIVKLSGVSPTLGDFDQNGESTNEVVGVSGTRTLPVTNFNGTTNGLIIGTAATWNSIIGNETAGGSTEKMTFSAWIFKTGNGSSIYPRIIDFGNTIVLSTTTSDAISFYSMLNNQYVNWQTPNGIFPLNTWTHVAVSYDASNSASSDPKIYVNGSLVSVSLASGAKHAANNPITGNAVIGNNPQFNRGFQGKIAEVAIWNNLLEDDDISSIYLSTLGQTGLEAPSVSNICKELSNYINNSSLLLSCSIANDSSDDATLLISHDSGRKATAEIKIDDGSRLISTSRSFGLGGKSYSTEPKSIEITDNSGKKINYVYTSDAGGSLKTGDKIKSAQAPIMLSGVAFISLRKNSVTGTGTKFLSEVRPNNRITIDGVTRTVVSVEHNEHLVCDDDWHTTAGSLSMRINTATFTGIRSISPDVAADSLVEDRRYRIKNVGGTINWQALGASSNSPRVGEEFKATNAMALGANHGIVEEYVVGGVAVVTGSQKDYTTHALTELINAINSTSGHNAGIVDSNISARMDYGLNEATPNGIAHARSLFLTQKDRNFFGNHLIKTDIAGFSDSTGFFGGHSQIFPIVESRIDHASDAPYPLIEFLATSQSASGDLAIIHDESISEKAAFTINQPSPVDANRGLNTILPHAAEEALQNLSIKKYIELADNNANSPIMNKLFSNNVIGVSLLLSYLNDRDRFPVRVISIGGRVQLTVGSDEQLIITIKSDLDSNNDVIFETRPNFIDTNAAMPTLVTVSIDLSQRHNEPIVNGGTERVEKVSNKLILVEDSSGNPISFGNNKILIGGENQYDGTSPFNTTTVVRLARVRIYNCPLDYRAYKRIHRSPQKVTTTPSLFFPETFMSGSKDNFLFLESSNLNTSIYLRNDPTRLALSATPANNQDTLIISGSKLATFNLKGLAYPSKVNGQYQIPMNTYRVFRDIGGYTNLYLRRWFAARLYETINLAFYNGDSDISPQLLPGGSLLLRRAKPATVTIDFRTATPSVYNAKDIIFRNEYITRTFRGDSVTDQAPGSHDDDNPSAGISRYGIKDAAGSMGIALSFIKAFNNSNFSNTDRLDTLATSLAQRATTSFSVLSGVARLNTTSLAAGQYIEISARGYTELGESAADTRKYVVVDAPRSNDYNEDNDANPGHPLQTGDILAAGDIITTGTALEDGSHLIGGIVLAVDIQTETEYDLVSALTGAIDSSAGHQSSLLSIGNIGTRPLSFRPRAIELSISQTRPGESGNTQIVNYISGSTAPNFADGTNDSRVRFERQRFLGFNKILSITGSLVNHHIFSTNLFSTGLYSDSTISLGGTLFDKNLIVFSSSSVSFNPPFNNIPETGVPFSNYNNGNNLTSKNTFVVGDSPILGSIASRVHGDDYLSVFKNLSGAVTSSFSHGSKISAKFTDIFGSKTYKDVKVKNSKVKLEFFQNVGGTAGNTEIIFSSSVGKYEELDENFTVTNFSGGLDRVAARTDSSDGFRSTGQRTYMLRLRTLKNPLGNTDGVIWSIASSQKARMYLFTSDSCRTLNIRAFSTNLNDTAFFQASISRPNNGSALDSTFENDEFVTLFIALDENNSAVDPSDAGSVSYFALFDSSNHGGLLAKANFVKSNILDNSNGVPNKVLREHLTLDANPSTHPSGSAHVLFGYGNISNGVASNIYVTDGDPPVQRGLALNHFFDEFEIAEFNVFDSALEIDKAAMIAESHLVERSKSGFRTKPPKLLLRDTSKIRDKFESLAFTDDASSVQIIEPFDVIYPNMMPAGTTGSFIIRVGTSTPADLNDETFAMMFPDGSQAQFTFDSDVVNSSGIAGDGYTLDTQAGTLNDVTPGIGTTNINNSIKVGIKDLAQQGIANAIAESINNASRYQNVPAKANISSTGTGDVEVKFTNPGQASFSFGNKAATIIYSNHMNDADTITLTSVDSSGNQVTKTYEFISPGTQASAGNVGSVVMPDGTGGDTSYAILKQTIEDATGHDGKLAVNHDAANNIVTITQTAPGNFTPPPMVANVSNATIFPSFEQKKSIYTISNSSTEHLKFGYKDSSGVFQDRAPDGSINTLKDISGVDKDFEDLGRSKFEHHIVAGKKQEKISATLTFDVSKLTRAISDSKVTADLIRARNELAVNAGDRLIISPYDPQEKDRKFKDDTVPLKPALQFKISNIEFKARLDSKRRKAESNDRNICVSDVSTSEDLAEAIANSINYAIDVKGLDLDRVVASGSSLTLSSTSISAYMGVVTISGYAVGENSLIKSSGFQAEFNPIIVRESRENVVKVDNNKIKPFVDVPTSADDEFLLFGTEELNYTRFGASTRSKVRIEIDINPIKATTLGMTTGSLEFPHDGFEVGSFNPIGYFNFASKSWESITKPGFTGMVNTVTASDHDKSQKTNEQSIAESVKHFHQSAPIAFGGTYGFSIHRFDVAQNASCDISVADGDADVTMAELQYVTLTSSRGVEKNYFLIDDANTSVTTGTKLTATSDIGSRVIENKDTANLTEGRKYRILTTGGTSNWNALGASSDTPLVGEVFTATSETHTGVDPAGTVEEFAVGGIAVAINLTGAVSKQNAFLVELAAAINSAEGHNSGTLNSVIAISEIPPEANGLQTVTLSQVEKGVAGETTPFSNVAGVTIGKFSGGYSRVADKNLKFGASDKHFVELPLRGRPISNFGFPFADTYKPSEGQKLDLRRYLDGPFLLEKFQIICSASITDEVSEGLARVLPETPEELPYSHFNNDLASNPDSPGYLGDFNSKYRSLNGQLLYDQLRRGSTAAGNSTFYNSSFTSDYFDSSGTYHMSQPDVYSDSTYHYNKIHSSSMNAITADANAWWRCDTFFLLRERQSVDTEFIVTGSLSTKAYKGTDNTLDISGHIRLQYLHPDVRSSSVANDYYQDLSAAAGYPLLAYMWHESMRIKITNNGNSLTIKPGVQTTDFRHFNPVTAPITTSPDGKDKVVTLGLHWLNHPNFILSDVRSYINYFSDHIGATVRPIASEQTYLDIDFVDSFGAGKEDVSGPDPRVEIIVTLNDRTNRRSDLGTLTGGVTPGSIARITISDRQTLGLEPDSNVKSLVSVVGSQSPYAMPEFNKVSGQSSNLSTSFKGISVFDVPLHKIEHSITQSTRELISYAQVAYYGYAAQNAFDTSKNHVEATKRHFYFVDEPGQLFFNDSSTTRSSREHPHQSLYGSFESTGSNSRTLLENGLGRDLNVKIGNALDAYAFETNLALNNSASVQTFNTFKISPIKELTSEDRLQSTAITQSAGVNVSHYLNNVLNKPSEDFETSAQLKQLQLKSRNHSQGLFHGRYKKNSASLNLFDGILDVKSSCKTTPSLFSYFPYRIAVVDGYNRLYKFPANGGPEYRRLPEFINVTMNGSFIGGTDYDGLGNTRSFNSILGDQPAESTFRINTAPYSFDSLLGKDPELDDIKISLDTEVNLGTNFNINAPYVLQPSDKITLGFQTAVPGFHSGFTSFVNLGGGITPHVLGTNGTRQNVSKEATPADIDSGKCVEAAFVPYPGSKLILYGSYIQDNGPKRPKTSIGASNVISEVIGQEKFDEFETELDSEFSGSLASEVFSTTSIQPGSNNTVSVNFSRRTNSLIGYANPQPVYVLNYRSSPTLGQLFITCGGVTTTFEFTDVGAGHGGDMIAAAAAAKTTIESNAYLSQKLIIQIINGGEVTISARSSDEILRISSTMDEMSVFTEDPSVSKTAFLATTGSINRFMSIYLGDTSVEQGNSINHDMVFFDSMLPGLDNYIKTGEPGINRIARAPHYSGGGVIPSADQNPNHAQFTADNVKAFQLDAQLFEKFGTTEENFSQSKFAISISSFQPSGSTAPDDLDRYIGNADTESREFNLDFKKRFLFENVNKEASTPGTIVYHHSIDIQDIRDVNKNPNLGIVPSTFFGAGANDNFSMLVTQPSIGGNFGQCVEPEVTIASRLAQNNLHSAFTQEKAFTRQQINTIVQTYNAHFAAEYDPDGTGTPPVSHAFSAVPADRRLHNTEYYVVSASNPSTTPPQNLPIRLGTYTSQPNRSAKATIVYAGSPPELSTIRLISADNTAITYQFINNGPAQASNAKISTHGEKTGLKENGDINSDDFAPGINTETQDSIVNLYVDGVLFGPGAESEFTAIKFRVEDHDQNGKLQSALLLTRPLMPGEEVVISGYFFNGSTTTEDGSAVRSETPIAIVYENSSAHLSAANAFFATPRPGLIDIPEDGALYRFIGQGIVPASNGSNVGTTEGWKYNTTGRSAATETQARNRDDTANQLDATLHTLLNDGNGTYDVEQVTDAFASRFYSITIKNDSPNAAFLKLTAWDVTGTINTANGSFWSVHDLRAEYSGTADTQYEYFKHFVTTNFDIYTETINGNHHDKIHVTSPSNNKITMTQSSLNVATEDGNTDITSTITNAVVSPSFAGGTGAQQPKKTLLFGDPSRGTMLAADGTTDQFNKVNVDDSYANEKFFLRFKGPHPFFGLHSAIHGVDQVNDTQFRRNAAALFGFGNHPTRLLDNIPSSTFATTFYPTSAGESFVGMEGKRNGSEFLPIFTYQGSSGVMGLNDEEVPDSGADYVAVTNAISRMIVEHPKGVKYGLMNYDHIRPSVKFRRNRFGQFRDMLEGRKYGAMANVNQPFKIAGGLGEQPNGQTSAVEVKFFNTEGSPMQNVNLTDPLSILENRPVISETFSQNLDKFQRSSVPFFDLPTATGLDLTDPAQRAVFGGRVRLEQDILGQEIIAV